jgi:thiopeptide-type bacteriocin biosynthesis protein
MPADQLTPASPPTPARPGSAATAEPAWEQVFVEFADWDNAEQAAAERLAPILDQASAAGLISGWWFIRKRPCWRVRVLPGYDRAAMRATVETALDSLSVPGGPLRHWLPGTYEAEEAAFGGPEAMTAAHRLFAADSTAIMRLAAGDKAGLGRRELSVLLCTTLLRGAGLEWYEQGDAWHRVTRERPLPPNVTAAQLTGLTESTAALLTADTTPGSGLLDVSGPLAGTEQWVAAFRDAGKSLSGLARSGTLQRGLREVLSYHVIFHWNRLGLPTRQQAALARAARDAILGPQLARPARPAPRPATGKAPDPCQVIGRFPLVPRPRLACPSLEARIAQVRSHALSADEETDPERKVDLACTTWNQAALIASDCGLPGWAAELCERQFAILRAAWPVSGRTAVASLQPLVNLARLDIRAGQPEDAHRSLTQIARAVRDGSTADLGGRQVSFQDFSPAAGPELVPWLRDVLLQDGTRALTAAGKWDQAAEHAAWHDDTPQRMSEARQSRIAASIHQGDPEFALALASSGTRTEPWEDAVAAVLRACAVLVSGQPLPAYASGALTAAPRACPSSAGTTVFGVKLSLAAAELAAGHPDDQEALVSEAVRGARHSQDAYAALEVASNPLARALVSASDAQYFADTISRAGLGQQAIADHLADSLAESLDIAGSALAQARARPTPPPGKPGRNSALRTSTGSIPGPSPSTCLSPSPRCRTTPRTRPEPRTTSPTPTRARSPHVPSSPAPGAPSSTMIRTRPAGRQATWPTS